MGGGVGAGVGPGAGFLPLLTVIVLDGSLHNISTGVNCKLSIITPLEPNEPKNWNKSPELFGKPFFRLFVN